VNGELVLSNTTAALRDMWEETSFQLEKLQTNPACVANEQKLLQIRHAPLYFVSFDPKSIIARTVQTLSTGCAPDELSQVSIFSLYVKRTLQIIGSEQCGKKPRFFFGKFEKHFKAFKVF